MMNLTSKQDSAPLATSTKAPLAPRTHPRYLHVAALPFPAPQGTQAAVHAMTAAHHRGPDGAHLLTYGARFGTRPIPYPCHRVENFPAIPSFRSGPSWRKVVLDLRIAKKLRTLHRTVRPDWVIAHHVEAAAAAILAGTRPTLFIAHTALGPELPSYLPKWMPKWPFSWAGHALDGTLTQRVEAVAAVSPYLAFEFESQFGLPVGYIPLPWDVPRSPPPELRPEAREAWGFHSEEIVLLYAGNLDAYQGWEDLLFALARLDTHRFQLLVATESAPEPLWSLARTLGFADRVRVAPIQTEEHRRRAHAACDLAIIPRRTPGGIPVKMLDALSRSTPTVAVRRATAGLPLQDIAWLADDDSPRALAQVIQLALDHEDPRRDRAELGRAYMLREHCDDAYFRAIYEATSDESLHR